MDRSFLITIQQIVSKGLFTRLEKNGQGLSFHVKIYYACDN